MYLQKGNRNRKTVKKKAKKCERIFMHFLAFIRIKIQKIYIYNYEIWYCCIKSHFYFNVIVL